MFARERKLASLKVVTFIWFRRSIMLVDDEVRREKL